MIFTRKPYQIDSVYFENNTLKIGCECKEYSESLTGGKACFTDAKGRITVSVFSPAGKIIAVKVTNHHAEPRAKSSEVIELAPSVSGLIEDSGDEIIFKSGTLEARINKKIFSIRFFYCGNELVSQTANMPVYYKTDSGSEHSYVNSSNSKTGASIDLGPREMIYGLGGAGASVIRNGQLVKGEDFTGMPGTEHIPFIVSDAKYGLFVNTNRPVTFDVGSVSGNLSFEAEGEDIEYNIIAGDTMAEVLEIFSQLNGHTPPLSYTTGGISLALEDDYTLTAQEIVDKLRAALNAGINVKELWLGNLWHPDYAPYGFTFDTVRFPDPKNFARTIFDMGITLGISINPYVSERAPEYQELLDTGCLISYPDGCAVLCDADKGGVASLDLNIPAARSWFLNTCTGLAAAGYSIYESNYTHQLTEAFENAVGKKGYLLNFPGILNSGLSEVSAREHGRLGSFIISDTVSSGDQKAPYMNIYSTLEPDYPDLTAALKSAISYGLTGFGGINIDIPARELTDPKLFERWTGFASYAPHTRFRGTLRLLEDAKTSDAIRSLSAIRTVLAPYIYSCLCENVNYGTPVVRAMALEFAGDPAAVSFDTEYMLGSSLLVSPVTTQNDNVRVYIPSGIWTDFMTHEKIQGPRYISRKASSTSVPVFVRPNSIVPTRTPDANTISGALDNLTFTCFGLSQGATAACEVFADGGKNSGIITAEVSGNKITVRTKNLGGTKHLILSGIFNVVGLSESVPDKLSYGTSVEFSSNELVISLG
ncbi:TIM-barrel domain-containing protein [Butyrivibrio sp. AE2032]|uniref:TIM-barrel domain-containing protein n=1 Tax=Butyrivibrio sp. AE2032 TaxID=1458463 RepID=UPI000556BCEB|nr:TIM-barrel domain-containing protein [Butyrivibrio sp. AE2032]